MNRLAFSLPVHENNAVVHDNVANIFRFNPGSLVVLHVSKLFADFDAAGFASIPNVYVIPRQLATAHGKGLMACHASNFKVLEQHGVAFDTFCLISSNEMFIRPGLAEYASKVQNAFQAHPFDLRHGWHLFDRRIDQQPGVQRLLHNLNLDKVYGGQAEGQFFERSVFAEVCNEYLVALGDADIIGFETEELVPQTVCIGKGIAPSPPFTLVDYSHALDYRHTQQGIARLADPCLTGRVKIDLGRKSKYFLVSPHQDLTNESIFSVKRVPREINHPLRVFVNQLPTPPSTNAVHARLVPLVPGMWWKKRVRQVGRSVNATIAAVRMRLGLRTRLRGALAAIGASQSDKQSNG